MQVTWDGHGSSPLEDVTSEIAINSACCATFAMRALINPYPLLSKDRDRKLEIVCITALAI